MNSSLQELKFPMLDSFRKRGFRLSCRTVEFVAAIAFFIGVAILIVCAMDNQKRLTSYKPEIRLDSLIVCSTNTSNNLLIWDLKFDITNPNNYSILCIDLDVSIFSYNRTKLLTMATDIQRCIGPNNHTPAIGFAHAYIQDPNDLDRANGNLRFDLKIHGQLHFKFYSAGDPFHRGELVCGDAKVDLSPSSDKSSCGTMVGDPFACSYQRYYKKYIWDSY